MRRALRAAAQRTALAKRATRQTFRHSSATHPLGDGNDIPTIRERPGHQHASTTTVYTHVLNQPGGRGVSSPLDPI